MEFDLEERWDEAVRQKNLIVEGMEKGITIPHNWNQRVMASLAKERIEVEKRYGIKIGQTDIYCARCNKPWGFGQHTCQDIRFEKLSRERNQKISELKKSEDKALLILSDLRPQKASILLMIPEGTVTNWIQRGSVPERHIENVLNLKRRV